jgi:hypothetical protein
MERTRDNEPPTTGSKVGGPSIPRYLMTIGRGLVVVVVGMWSYGGRMGLGTCGFVERL